MPPDAPALVFDTSGPFCAVAVWRGGARLAHAIEAMKTGQSERLFPMVEAALSQAGVALSDLSRIVVATGPGNFTGTRIGVAAARGLALSTGVQAVGVSRLAALGGGVGTAAVAALKDHAYVQAFAGGSAQPDPALMPLADLADMPNLSKRLVEGNAASKGGGCMGVLLVGVAGVGLGLAAIL